MEIESANIFIITARATFPAKQRNKLFLLIYAIGCYPFRGAFTASLRSVFSREVFCLAVFLTLTFHLYIITLGVKPI